MSRAQIGDREPFILSILGGMPDIPRKIAIVSLTDIAFVTVHPAYRSEVSVIPPLLLHWSCRHTTRSPELASFLSVRPEEAIQHVLAVTLLA